MWLACAGSIGAKPMLEFEPHGKRLRRVFDKGLQWRLCREMWCRGIQNVDVARNACSVVLAALNRTVLYHV